MDINFFNTRKTIRKYKDEAIPEGELTKMLEAAAMAPTTGGMQLYSVVVTSDNDIKKELAACHFNQPAATGAPLLLTFCADFNRFIKWCEANDAKPGFNNFQSFVAAFLDATIFAQQFCTIAEMQGYGCCYLGTTTYNAPQIAKILNLPTYVVPVATLSVGAPDDGSVKAERIPAEGIIHKERYADYSASDIKSLYSDKEAMPANKQFVADNHKQTLAQVFTDIRYSKQSNETFSKVFFDFIDQQGFKFPQ